MGPVRLLVSLSGLGPGAPLAAAADCCDALDARRVPLTLLVGPRPHPEVAAFAAARRRAGDAVLMLGFRSVHDDARPYRRLPVLEARLRLAGATRSAEALGLEPDGFAAPGWSVSEGTRRALAEAGLGLLLDDSGVHRLGRDGVPTAGLTGPVVRPREPAPSFRGLVRTRRRPAEPALRHLTVEVATAVDALVAAVDVALADGAVPAVPTGLVGPAHRPSRRAGGALDPELWPTTA
jgi:predicted deacetylase